MDFSQFSKTHSSNLKMEADVNGEYQEKQEQILKRGNQGIMDSCHYEKVGKKKN